MAALNKILFNGQRTNICSKQLIVVNASLSTQDVEIIRNIGVNAAIRLRCFI